MKSYFWVPGNARHDRGYTLEEALVAVGPGWGELVKEAWYLVDEAGGGVIQVKEKWFGLRVYFRVPPEHEERVQERVDAIEANELRYHRGEARVVGGHGLSGADPVGGTRGAAGVVECNLPLRRFEGGALT